MMIFQDFLLIFIITIFINWFIYGLIPFNVSRSNSVIILKYLGNNNGHYKTKKDIINYVQDKYFNEYDAIGLRLSEQLKAGNIKKLGDEYFITEKGIFIIHSFLFISRLYNLENNFLED
jgi:energy-coupling factor transporter transmembrane protein EcfT